MASDFCQRLNVSPSTLSRWAKKGLIERVERGVYVHRHSPVPDEYFDFAAACSSFGPQAVVGGASALFYYHLIDTPPQQVWLMLPSHKKNERASKKYKCLRTWTPCTMGVCKKRYFKITNVERTLVEAIKFSSQLGRSTASSAFRRAFEQRLTQPAKVLRMSVKMKFERSVAAMLEVTTIE